MRQTALKEQTEVYQICIHWKHRLTVNRLNEIRQIKQVIYILFLRQPRQRGPKNT